LVFLLFFKALDFGCGVGRMTIPLSRKFEEVAGVDISPSMIEEAKRNSLELERSNIKFFDDLSNVGTFDFIHSFITFQHIPTKTGEKILSRLLNLLNNNGVAVLHFSFFREAVFFRKFINSIRKNFKPFNYFCNVLQRKPVTIPFMQMNNYNLSRITKIFHQNNISQGSFELTKHGTHLGIIFFLKKEKEPSEEKLL